MAIEAITGSKQAYQGSAPVSNTAQINAERVSAPDEVTPPAVSENLEVKPQAQTTVKNEEGTAVVSSGTDAMKKAVEEINRNAKSSEAIFGIHEATNRVTIKIVDKESKEIIKEFPPEKTLDMIAKVWEMAGLMVDEKR